MKAWELARLILPSISSRAPDKTHLPAPEQDHGNLFVFVQTPRTLWQAISGSVDFTSTRKTARTPRHDGSHHLPCCECAMEPSALKSPFCTFSPERQLVETWQT